MTMHKVVIGDNGVLPYLKVFRGGKTRVDVYAIICTPGKGELGTLVWIDSFWRDYQ